ncbi:MAG TPA: DUF1415 family protein [Polyangia bacterium]
MRREALRLCDRYIDEVVLAFGLCPWASPSLRAGSVAREAVTRAAPVPADCLAAIDEWEAAEPAIAVGLLVIPRFAGGRAAFDTFAEGVRRADRARRGAGAEAAFVVAAFHPAGPSQFVGPHQAVSFLRRSPDPMLQLVRAELLAGVKAAGAGDDVSTGVATRNHATLMAEGAKERFEVVIRALRADRDEAYARLGLL